MNDTETLQTHPRETELERYPMRPLAAGDLEAVIAIDAAVGGARRTEFFRAKIRRAVEDSSLQMSLACELDGMVAGFLLASFHFGEFGLAEPTAVIEAIGVHPEYGGRGVGRALLEQLETNLAALGVEALRTEVDWRQLELLGFFAACGFGPSARLCLEKRLPPFPGRD
jgi:ribosomal protein S18 acetylase RimI-like enzyme